MRFVDGYRPFFLLRCVDIDFIPFTVLGIPHVRDSLLLALKTIPSRCLTA